MKYFTPELIGAGQAPEESVLGDVERQWDDSCARYQAYLATIQADLPPGLRHLEGSYYLHDSRVRAMGRKDHSFVIMLQLDTPPHFLLTFTYDLLQEPAIRQGMLPRELCSSDAAADWQYDEIEKVAGDPPTWRQVILLSNGWEVDLHFHDVQVQEIQPLLPVLHDWSNPVSQSA